MFKDLEQIKLNVENADKIIMKQGLVPRLFCIVPFTNIILEPNGSVGICRQKGTKFSVGNIKNNTITEIWNNEFVRKWRREFLEGKIDICKVDIKHEQCNRCPENNKLLPYVDFNEFQQTPILKLTANFNGKCNLQCQMCDVWKMPNGLYDEINFWEPAKVSIFPHLKEIDMLSGEPLIQPDTYKLIDEVFAVNPKCNWTITSNIHWKFSKKIKDTFDKIIIKTLIISIDSLRPEVYGKIRYPGKLDLVLSTLDELLEYRKNSKKFDIHLNFLVQKDNWSEVFTLLDFCYEKQINPFLTFLYEPERYSLLTEPVEKIETILEVYFTQLDQRNSAHLKRILLPLIEKLPKIIQADYLLRLQQLLSKKTG